MANYTPNYQLHQWAPEDKFLRTDFNEDLNKIDTALGEGAAKAAALETAVKKFGNCQVEYSVYVGTGTSGENGKASISFPREPALAILVNDSGGAYFLYKGMSYTISSSRGNIYFQWSDNTVSWYANFGVVTNAKGVSYPIIAFYRNE